MATYCVRRALSLSAARSRMMIRFPFYNIQERMSDPKFLDRDYFEREAENVPFGDGYIDALGKIWYERETYRKEIMYRSADNLVGHKNYWLPELDEFEPAPGYEDVEALKTAPESVKKIFSVKFQNKDIYAQKMVAMLVKMVRPEFIDDPVKELRKTDGDLSVRSL